MNLKKTTLALTIGACFASAATAEETKVLAPVVVTATRVEQDSFDLPMSIDKVEKKDIQDGQLRMTLSESLGRVPGITAQNRNQMAQDPQISSRGFGARSSFGVRGLRIYVDGIPLSMPDGIGNPGSVDLGAISSIEVMRGPFSAMYGNSSGGVIQLLTETPAGPPEVTGDVLFGSFNTRRESVQASGIQKGVEYFVSYSDYSSDGYRQQSKNDKQQATAKIGLKLQEDTKLITLINWFDQFAQDPGGLPKTGTSTSPGALDSNQYYNPAGATVGAIYGKTRVMRSNTQVGFNLEKSINKDNALNVILYAGQRDNLQYLATGNTATNTPGRASSIARDFYGVELRLTNKGEMLDRPYTVSYGINAGFMKDARLDQPTTLGELNGQTATRDETQKATNFDQYAQGSWSVADRWDLHAGVRHTSLNLDIKNKLSTTTGNGSMNFDKTLPVLGAVFKVTPTFNVYANVGKGFETPTLVEVTYIDPTVTPTTGPNLTLKPSTSTNYELGTKLMTSDTSRLSAAIFNIDTENEIVVDKLQGSTGSYKNAGKTNRYGAEISAEALLPNDFSLYAAYTFLNATFETPFNYGNSNTPVAAGARIPGTYRTQLYAEAAWRHQPLGFVVALEGKYNSKVYTVDDNSSSAPSFSVFNLRTSFQQKTGQWKITEYARIDNLFDEAYIGSVRVNDANSRFYEPAPGRNWIVGVKANYQF